MPEPLIDSLIALSGPDRVIVVHRAFVYFTGSLEAGMLLGQLLYWTPRARIPGGWIAKSDAEWVSELCLSPYKVRQARKALEDMAIVETKLARFAGAPTVHYRIDRQALHAAWVDWLDFSDFANSQNGFAESLPILRKRKMDLPNSQNGFGENEESCTEITAEITAETTSISAPDPETLEWIADLETQAATLAAAGRPAPRTDAEIMAGTRAASDGWRRRLAEKPHLTWGNKSQTAQRALAALDGNAEAVQLIGHQLEHSFHLSPDWDTPKAVKTWISQIAAALKAGDHDPEIVIAAARKLRADDCTVAGPKSLVNTARALAANREGDEHAAHSEHATDHDRWTQADVDAANAQANAALHR